MKPRDNRQLLIAATICLPMMGFFKGLSQVSPCFQGALCYYGRTGTKIRLGDLPTMISFCGVTDRGSGVVWGVAACSARWVNLFLFRLRRTRAVHIYQVPAQRAAHPCEFSAPVTAEAGPHSGTPRFLSSSDSLCWYRHGVRVGWVVGARPTFLRNRCIRCCECEQTVSSSTGGSSPLFRRVFALLLDRYLPFKWLNAMMT